MKELWRKTKLYGPMVAFGFAAFCAALVHHKSLFVIDVVGFGISYYIFKREVALQRHREGGERVQ